MHTLYHRNDLMIWFINNHAYIIWLHYLLKQIHYQKINIDLINHSNITSQTNTVIKHCCQSHTSGLFPALTCGCMCTSLYWLVDRMRWKWSSDKYNKFLLNSSLPLSTQTQLFIKMHRYQESGLAWSFTSHAPHLNNNTEAEIMIQCFNVGVGARAPGEGGAKCAFVCFSARLKAVSNSITFC